MYLSYLLEYNTKIRISVTSNTGECIHFWVSYLVSSQKMLKMLPAYNRLSRFELFTRKKIMFLCVTWQWLVITMYMWYVHCINVRIHVILRCILFARKWSCLNLLLLLKRLNHWSLLEHERYTDHRYELH